MLKRLLSLGLSAVVGLSLIPGALAAGEQPKIQSVSASGYHVLAVDDQGGLWAWGWNQRGQLGDPALDNSGGDAEGPFLTVPAKLMEDVTSASAGSGISMALKRDGTLWVWGDDGPPRIWMEDVVTSASDPTLKSAAAITSDGVLWLWGDNSMGQLAPGGVTEAVWDTPVPVMEHAVGVAMNYGCIMALKNDGTLWTWGNDNYGVLGREGAGDLEGEGLPYCPIPAQIMEDVAALAPGGNESFAVKTDGSLWAWGLVREGILAGLGRSNAVNDSGEAVQTIPVQVMERVASAHPGQAQYILKTDGTLWACGNDQFGELGRGTVDEPSKTPIQIMTDVLQVTGGDCFAVALKTDGTLWTWGTNGEGELGNGGRGNRESNIGPIQSLPCQVDFTAPALPAGEVTAYPGVPFAFLTDQRWGHLSLYGLENEKGDRTYYVRVRDVAAELTETPAQFNVEYDAERDTYEVVTGERYRPQTGDGDLPFAGIQPAQRGGAGLTVDGQRVPVDAITLTDSAGMPHTYYRLRDLGRALGFNVRWDSTYHHEFLPVSGRILLETDRPYTDHD